MSLEMTVSEARARLADVLDTARTTHDPVFLTRHGKRIGVIAGIDQWQQASPGPASAVSTDDIRSQIEQISRQAMALVQPGTVPLTDPESFYQTRQPRL